jgi:hypothetical protein
MAQIGRKVLLLRTRFSQHMAAERIRFIVQEKAPALAGMSGMHASAGAPTRAPDDRRARRADEVSLRSCRCGDRPGGVASGRSLPGAMAISL